MLFVGQFPVIDFSQCAVLEKLGVVDGVVTEDSDAFLFGARTVYKNIFDERKYVEAYLASDGEKELGIGQNEFVSFQLCGNRQHYDFCGRLH